MLCLCFLHLIVIRKFLLLNKTVIYVNVYVYSHLNWNVSSSRSSYFCWKKNIYEYHKRGWGEGEGGGLESQQWTAIYNWICWLFMLSFLAAWTWFIVSELITVLSFHLLHQPSLPSQTPFHEWQLLYIPIR